jgi:hypothetical protein
MSTNNKCKFQVKKIKKERIRTSVKVWWRKEDSPRTSQNTCLTRSTPWRSRTSKCTSTRMSEKTTTSQSVRILIDLRYFIILFLICSKFSSARCYRSTELSSYNCVLHTVRIVMRPQSKSNTISISIKSCLCCDCACKFKRIRGRILSKWKEANHSNIQWTLNWEVSPEYLTTLL